MENETPNFDFNLLNQDTNASRFVPVSDLQVNKLIESEENTNTKRKTAYDMKLVNQFLQEQGESRQVENIPTEELNNHLSRFIFAARTKKGEDYEPSSLRGILASVERHLNRSGYGKSIIKDIEFVKTREALKAKQKSLKREGKGNKPRATTALSDEEINILYSKKLLGIASPLALVNTVWLNNMLHFGLRGCKEQRELQWGDVTLKQDSEGKEYLEYSVERQTKTRTGEDPRNQRPVKPRMYGNETAESNERDPVHVYKVYRAKRPESMQHADSPFYLSVNYFKSEAELKAEGSKWLKSQAMGVNKLNTLMKEMTETAGIAVKTNHSARKTLVQKLQDNDVPPNQIVQITGHRNLQSVNNYSSLRERQMENISRIMSTSTATTNALQLAQQNVHCNFSQAKSSTSAAENKVQSIFQGNYISGGVFNINLAPTKTVTSPKLEPNVKKRRYIIESDSSGGSQE